jgi:primosomal protein N' (replication factor Y)
MQFGNGKKRDQEAFLDLINELNLSKSVVHYSNDVAPSVKYKSFLDATIPPKIVLGSRSAIFAPVNQLASLLIYNDSDSSLIEPTSPYLATREIALLRQQQTNCQIVFASHSRSSEVQRLVEMEYLVELNATEIKPKIAATDSESRVDSLAYQTIRKSLEAGGSVLVQVSGAGTTSSLFCAKCSERSTCNRCNGPIGLNSDAKPYCRWCNAFNLDMRCQTCGANEFRQGRAGVTRTVAEFGKAFPGAQVVESSAAKRVLSLKPAKRINSFM